MFDSAPGRHFGVLHLANEFGQPWVLGRFGDSLFFRGPEVGDYVIVPDYPKAEKDQLTVSAWVLAESRPFYGMIAANWGGSGHPEPNVTGQFHFGLCGQDGDLAVQMTQHDGEWVQVREAGEPLPAGHLAARRVCGRRQDAPALPQRRRSGLDPFPRRHSRSADVEFGDRLQDGRLGEGSVVHHSRILARPDRRIGRFQRGPFGRDDSQTF